MSTRIASLPTTTDLVKRQLTKKRISPVNLAVSAALLFSLLASVVILLTILADTIAKALPVVQERGLEFVSAPLGPSAESAGLLQGVIGSFALTGVVIIVAFPLGVAAAIYLEEYATDTKISRIIGTNIRNLAGVPSIVYGILGFFLFVKLINRGLFGMDANPSRNLLAGGLTLAVLVLPIMIITTVEALRAVPRSLREASLAVGATKWQTIRSQVLPVALPAILTGSVLTISRAFGETAPLLLAGAVLSQYFGMSQSASMGDMITNQPYTALPLVIYNYARQPDSEFVALTAAAILVLLMMILTVNAVAIVVRDRFERDV